jgi:hypothetical protein
VDESAAITKWRGGSLSDRAEASEGGDQYCIGGEKRKNKNKLSTSDD